MKTEAEVRKLRDAIYGRQEQGGWNNCKENWMQPKNVQWLIDHQPKPVAPGPTPRASIK